MNQKWYTRLGWWLCELFRHPGSGATWEYNGQIHKECNLCGRIVSRKCPVKEDSGSEGE